MGQVTTGRVRYETPPIVEALCEFRFGQTDVQHVLIPGRYYERIHTDYPDIETRRGVGIEAGKELAMVTEERIVFRNPSATRLVQIGPGMLAINQLRPYPDYRTFRREIETRLSDYRAVAHPRELTKIGLRYINRLTLPEDQTLEAILRVGFKVPESLGAKADPFLLRLEFPYQAGRDRLILILAKAPDDTEAPGVMLDLDYVLVKPGQVREERLMEWVDIAHETVEDVFHMSVTEAALGSFGPVPAEKGRL